MPTYTYKCSKCSTERTAIRKINERKSNAPECCDYSMQQTITPMSTPMINSTSARAFEPYQCPATDEIVTSARQKKEVEAANGLIIKEKGMFPPRKKKEKMPELPKELQAEMKKQIQMQKNNLSTENLLSICKRLISLFVSFTLETKNEFDIK